ncbi:uncharacterized protein EI97DRAFT_361562, partial [Westerdykella ornata]
PNSRCSHSYCIPCLRAMFIGAAKDLFRMPPRCCHHLIQFHFARRHLTASEADEFKARYDEWNTPHPFYCPVAACSAFIPRRLLEKARKPGQSSAVVQCPKCAVSICTQCRAVAHPGTPCQLRHGLDSETENSLKATGYKRCPKCSNGVQRAHGCYVISCQCGAQWCWICGLTRPECRGHRVETLEDNDPE